ncbi:hypothetical protein [Bacillus cereus group sp. MYBK81-2]|uniref:hypothetical protein n=1 Tax=Bacillus cereus group sp. MYBK81-2 TaxID=3450604 RepID=UPI003F7A7E11
MFGKYDGLLKKECLLKRIDELSFALNASGDPLLEGIAKASGNTDIVVAKELIIKGSELGMNEQVFKKALLAKINNLREEVSRL